MWVNQSIQRALGVSVFGSCLIRVDPDYASIRFSVSSVRPEPREALDETRSAADRARGVFAQHRIEARDVRASRVTLLQWFEGQGDARRAVGYRSEIGFQVLVREIGDVESFLLDVVAAGAREIEGVSYKSSRLREIRTDARTGAVRAARAKAEVYASAAGLRIGNAIHIEDVNPDDLSRRSHMPDIDLADHDETDASATDVSGSIVVAGAVMACFALLE